MFFAVERSESEILELEEWPYTLLINCFVSNTNNNCAEYRDKSTTVVRWIGVGTLRLITAGLSLCGNCASTTSTVHLI